MKIYVDIESQMKWVLPGGVTCRISARPPTNNSQNKFSTKVLNAELLYDEPVTTRRALEYQNFLNSDNKALR